MRRAHIEETPDGFRVVLSTGEEAEFLMLGDARAWARDRGEQPPSPQHVRPADGSGRRAPGDPPIEWIVTLELSPGELHAPGTEGRRGQDKLAEAAERALVRAGFQEMWTSTDSLDAGIADIDAQTAGAEGDAGWTTWHRLAYVLTGVRAASTREEVIDRATEAAAGVMPAGWDVEAAARPA